MAGLRDHIIGLSGVHAVDLSAHVLTALVERSGIDPAVVEDVFWGCVSQVGEQTFNIGRMAALAAGWPETVPGTTHFLPMERPDLVRQTLAACVGL